MKEHYTLTGGARIGSANATYPFADLYVDREVLTINASIVGNLIFQSKDIISLQPESNGIKINHSVKNYNSKVIFWTFKNPALVIEEIERTGFLENKSTPQNYNVNDILKKQNEGSFPMKKAVAIIFGVVWNLLFLYDIIPFVINPKSKDFPLGVGANCALALLLASSILAIVSKHFRKIILKESRDLNDIRKFVYFTALMSGIALIISLSIS
jgi:hypothetical protein